MIYYSNMKDSDFYEMLAERDKIIDGLILSGIKNAMKDVNINERDGLKFAAKNVYDPFSLGYIADARVTFEENELLQNGEFRKFMEIDGRRREVAIELQNMAKEIRTSLLKTEHNKVYTYRYQMKFKQ